jgi:hypothetical protein
LLEKDGKGKLDRSRGKKEDPLYGIQEERDILHTIKRR